jgi:hypothetical protein
MIRLQVVSSGHSRAYRLVFLGHISFDLFMSTGDGAHITIGVTIYRFEASCGLGVWGKNSDVASV